MGTKIMDNPEESKFGMTKAQLIQGIKDLQKLGVKKILECIVFWLQIQ